MNYVNNKQLLEAIRKYKIKNIESASLNKKKPPIPSEAAHAFLLISERFAKKPSFSSYTYIEDMKGDAILACIKYFDNFDPDKYDNPFAYFTQVVKNAFINRINLEHKQAYIKAKSFTRTSGFVDADLEDFSTDGLYNVIDTYEEKIKVKKEKADLRKGSLVDNG